MVDITPEHFDIYHFLERRGKDNKRKSSRQTDNFGRCKCLDGFQQMYPDKMSGLVMGCSRQDSHQNLMGLSTPSFIR